ncbi:hypothetical protein I316_03939 [Kwoniella heveanensis BCC8398]|uniref:Uncharacterized protein n=1 Tax=Kwoniella heveanensis BCC8398 TaxID=1296120 RepID=A0A1B9GU80_9TREE|nr:hypothetical protein I316_03939 [Kwoniella heveanensis BCC8398]
MYVPSTDLIQYRLREQCLHKLTSVPGQWSASSNNNESAPQISPYDPEGEPLGSGSRTQSRACQVASRMARKFLPSTHSSAQLIWDGEPTGLSVGKNPRKDRPAKPSGSLLIWRKFPEV